MDARLKKKWVKALRSGDYKQGRDYLRNRETGAYCCLGVLCKTYGLPNEALDQKMTTTLPFDAGLDPTICSLLGNQMNDQQGQTFDQIADYIEANL